jgi:ATP-binding cassette, subfamily B, bacterial
VACLLQLLGALATAASVFVIRAVFGGFLAGGGSGHLRSTLPPLAVMAGLALTLELIQAAEGELNRILAERVSRTALDGVLDVATTVDLLAYEDPDFHDRLRRAQTQGLFRGYQTVQAVLALVGSLTAVVGILTAVATLQPLVLPILVAGYLPLWLLTSRNTLDLYDTSYDLTPNDRERNYLLQLLTSRDAAKEIRAFNLASFLRHRYDGLYDLRIESFTALARRRAARSFLGSLGSSVTLLFAVGVLAWLYSTGRLSLAATGAAAYGLYQLGENLRSVHLSGAGVYEATIFLRDYESFRRSQPPRRGRVGRAPRRFRELTVEGVSFTYPGAGTPALADVSLRVEAGQLVALVGENGSGKTTLAKLLAGLYTPDRGAIRWDGIDIIDVDREELRESIAVIFQDFERYRLRAHDNIALGRYERAADREAVEDAAVSAGAHDFLSRLPSGYETILGKEFLSGADLSVGEWQRVALARALFRDAPFVILDEPAAALDARAEARLAEHLRILLAGRAVLLISHRLAGARAADYIYVLGAGQVIEHGSHEELIAVQGIYAELFTLQASSYVDMTVPA